MTMSVVSRRAQRLVRLLRGLSTVFIVLTVLAAVVFVFLLVQGLVGGPVSLPLHVLLTGHTAPSGAAPHHVAVSITSVATELNVSMSHAPVGAVLLSLVSELAGLFIGGASAVAIRGALTRLEVGQPFSAVVARSLTVVAIVIAIGGVVADLSGWLAEVQLVGTPITIGSKIYLTTVEPWVPDLSGLYVAGLVFVIALVIRIGTTMQSELEEVV